MYPHENPGNNCVCDCVCMRVGAQREWGGGRQGGRGKGRKETQSKEGRRGEERTLLLLERWGGVNIPWKGACEELLEDIAS